MPLISPPTIAEREAELAALQSAFDEYITSSRELEEELDAELAKMQEKLAESSAANSALASQLENISPQLSSLEKGLADTKHKFEEESSMRRRAELAQDESEAKCREAEGALLSLKEDCDAAHEELAFRESELEETRLELEVEKERHRAEMEEAELNSPNMNGNVNGTANFIAKSSASVSTIGRREYIDQDGFSLYSGYTEIEDNDYVKRLEDELELVTEQLIDTEHRLTDAQHSVQLLQKNQASNGTNSTSSIPETVTSISLVDSNLPPEEELLRLKETHHLQLEELQTVKEELELAQEELQLTQEELKASEEDVSSFTRKMDAARAEHREEVSKLKSELENSQSEARTGNKDFTTMESTLIKSGKQTEQLSEELDNLNLALENAKADQAAATAELEEIYQKFDEAKFVAEKAGRQATLKETSEQTTSLRKSIGELEDRNTALQRRVEEASLVAAAGENSESETIKLYQDSLSKTKEDLVKKEQELEQIKTTVEERVASAEEKVVELEKELTDTKGKLYEAEATLIIVKKEKNGRSSSSSSLNVSPNSKSASVDEKDEEISKLEKEVENLTQQKRLYESRAKSLEEEVKSLQKQVFCRGDKDAPVVATQMSRLSSLSNINMLNKDEGLSTESSIIENIIATKDPEKMAGVLRDLENKTAQQRDYNAELLSKILTLQGNIQVCCRIRPLSRREIESGCKNVIEPLSESEMGCFDERSSKWKSFHFDKVWGPDQSQSTLFSDVEPLALSVVDGYNACIFAYGQTGSGKTYTMEGSPSHDEHGISYRTIQKLFTLLNLRAQQQRAFAADREEEKGNTFQFKLQLGMLEIYNDEIYDLLSDHAAAGSKEDQKRQAKAAGVKATLDIKRGVDGKIEVPGLTREPINCIKDVFSLLARGNSNRSTAATTLNEHSSRSHMVLSVEVESGLEGQPSNKGVLYLVDLAGSERVAKSQVEGAQLKEAAHINKSLSALGNVFEALDRKSSHVPFRDSKLTHLLQDAIGGNSRTMMVVAVCPTNHDESVHALQFATRVRRIQRKGPAQRNVVSKNLEETVKALTHEMKTLTKQKDRNETQLSSLKKDNNRIQEKLQNISTSRSKSQSDHKTLELLRKNNSDMAARWNKEKALRERQTADLENSKSELRKKQSELTRVAREKDSLERKLEEKENLLSKAQREARDAKDASSAANLRIRKQEILQSRNITPAKNSVRKSKPFKTPLMGTIPVSPSPSAKTTNSAAIDVEEVRKQVIALLEKHDKEKLGRIDVIMEKFAGKENLLVEKMKQRYEGAATRSELALARHKERMLKLQSKNQQQ